MRPWEHLEQRGATRLGNRALEVPFFAKITKTPLVSPKFDQTRSKLLQNSIFHSFTSNPSFSKIFNNFDQVWPEVDLGWA